MRCSLAGVVGVALALAAGTARADDVGEAEEKLAKARETYSATLSGIRDDVMKLIDEKDAAERKRANPDLAKLKAFKAEREALETDGDMPKWIDAKIKQRLDKSRGPLLDALTGMKSAYVRAKDDEKAAAIDREIKQVKQGESTTHKILGKWSWGGDTMVFDKKGVATQLLPSGKLSTKGLWKAQKDGTVALELENGWKITVEFEGDDKLRVLNVGPRGQREKTESSRLPNK